MHTLKILTIKEMFKGKKFNLLNLMSALAQTRQFSSEVSLLNYVTLTLERFKH